MYLFVFTSPFFALCGGFALTMSKNKMAEKMVRKKSDGYTPASKNYISYVLQLTVDGRLGLAMVNVVLHVERAQKKGGGNVTTLEAVG